MSNEELDRKIEKSVEKVVKGWAGGLTGLGAGLLVGAPFEGALIGHGIQELRKKPKINVAQQPSPAETRARLDAIASGRARPGQVRTRQPKTFTEEIMGGLKRKYGPPIKRKIKGALGLNPKTKPPVRRKKNPQLDAYKDAVRGEGIDVKSLRKGGIGSGRRPGIGSVKPIKMIKPMSTQMTSTNMNKPVLPGNSGALMQSLNKGEIKPMSEKKPVELRKAINSVNKALDMLQKNAPWVEEQDMLQNRDQLQQGQIQQKDPNEDKYSELGKWLPSALQGGGLDSLLAHPAAGQAIRDAAKQIGEKIVQKIGPSSGLEPDEVGIIVLRVLSNVIDDLEDEKLGKSWSETASGIITKAPVRKIAPALAAAGRTALNSAAMSAGQRVGEGIGDRMFRRSQDEIMTKAVVEDTDSKAGLPDRKPLKDSGGESDYKGDGTKMNVRDLAEKSETLEDTGV